MKALIITHIGALGLYLGAAVLFAHTGTFAIAAHPGLDATVKAVVLLMVLFAAWAKSAQVPMYMWLPFGHGGADACFGLPAWRLDGQGRHVRVRACTRLCRRDS